MKKKFKPEDLEKEEFKDVSLEWLREARRHIMATSIHDREVQRRKRCGRPSIKNIERKYTVDKQPRSFSVTREYDFLKYIGLVFKWALEEKKDLTRRELEILIYLYGFGHFYKNEYDQFYRAFCNSKYSSRQKLEEMIEKGYIKVIREQTLTVRRLYGLTKPCSIFITKIHRYCCGAEKLPRDNFEMKKQDFRRLGRYKIKRNIKTLDIIAKMDKDINDRDD